MENTRRLQTPDGREVVAFKTGFAPISPFYPCKFEAGGKKYFTAQHYYLALKARYFSDTEAEVELLKEPSPRQADRIAAYINNLNEEKWQEEKAAEAMMEANLVKMQKCFGPRRCLLATGKATIAFATEWDDKFGTGLPLDDNGNANPACWKGRNELGKILMDVREKIAG